MIDFVKTFICVVVAVVLFLIQKGLSSRKAAWLGGIMPVLTIISGVGLIWYMKWEISVRTVFPFVLLFLLLDEPLTALDVVVAEEMKQLLRTLKQHSIIILSTHIMDLALNLCDEIILLNHGLLEHMELSDLNSDAFKEKIISALREGTEW